MKLNTAFAAAAGVIVLGAIVLGVTALIGATPAAAKKGLRLKGEDLLKTVSGSTIYLKTPLGSLPIKYAEDGTMSGRSRKLAYYTGSVSDRGKWFIRRNKLCQRWRRWLDRELQCFAIRQRGKTFYWRRNDGTKGTARVARRPLARLAKDPPKKIAKGAGNVANSGPPGRSAARKVSWPGPTDRRLSRRFIALPKLQSPPQRVYRR